MGNENTGAAASAAAKVDQSAEADESPNSAQILPKKLFAKHGIKIPDIEQAAANQAKVEDRNKSTGAEAEVEHPETEETATAGSEESNDGKTETEGAAGEQEETGGEGADTNEVEGDASKGAAADAEKVRARLKDLPEPQRKIAQSIIDERIHAITAKSKAETERLGARVVELTTELESSQRSKGPIVVPGVHPTMLVETAAEIDAYSDELDRAEDMLDRYKENGIEADEVRGMPAYTADQVRDRLREIRREREREIPKARELLTKRAADEATVRASYPALFDPRTDDYRVAQTLRKALPEIRRMPDAATFVAKFVLGARALEAMKDPETGKKTPASKGGTPGAAATKTKTVLTTRKAPRAPGAGAPAVGSVLDDPRTQQTDAAEPMKTFTNTRSRESLKGAIRALVFR